MQREFVRPYWSPPVHSHGDRFAASTSTIQHRPFNIDRSTCRPNHQQRKHISWKPAGAPLAFDAYSRQHAILMHLRVHAHALPCSRGSLPPCCAVQPSPTGPPPRADVGAKEDEKAPARRRGGDRRSGGRGLCSTASPAPAPYPARALQKQLHYHPSPIRASARWITRPLDRATAPRHSVSPCCCCCIARRLAGAAAAVVVKERPVGAGMATLAHWVREQLDTGCGGYVEP